MNEMRVIDYFFDFGQKENEALIFPQSSMTKVIFILQEEGRAKISGQFSWLAVNIMA